MCHKLKVFFFLLKSTLYEKEVFSFSNGTSCHCIVYINTYGQGHFKHPTLKYNKRKNGNRVIEKKNLLVSQYLLELDDQLQNLQSSFSNRIEKEAAKQIYVYAVSFLIKLCRKIYKKKQYTFIHIYSYSYGKAFVYVEIPIKYIMYPFNLFPLTLIYYDKIIVDANHSSYLKTNGSVPPIPTPRTIQFFQSNHWCTI